jgi:hypothetical protein
MLLDDSSPRSHPSAAKITGKTKAGGKIGRVCDFLTSEA